MNVFIVYCHPSDDSLTCLIKDSFIRGLKSAGHRYVLSDLYKMKFNSIMSKDEYSREGYYRRELPVLDDVRIEQEKINAACAIVFIYPVFWSSPPALLLGWIDRVWTYGFAYGENRSMKQLDKGLVIVSAGNTLEYFERTGIGAAMKKVMLDDILFDRVKQKEMIILEAASRELPQREANMKKYLQTAFKAGMELSLVH